MQEPLIIKILTITIGILHFMQEPLKILTITIGILHFMQEPLIKKILTITIGILHFVQEPLIIIKTKYQCAPIIIIIKTEY